MPSVMFSIMNQILLKKLHIKGFITDSVGESRNSKIFYNPLMKLVWMYLIDSSTNPFIIVGIILEEKKKKGKRLLLVITLLKCRINSRLKMMPEYFYRYIHWNIITCCITNGIANIIFIDYFIIFILSIILLEITNDTNFIANSLSNFR